MSSSSPAPPPSSRSGIHLGLENMRILMSHLPPINIPYIHIAGTNGKGSVSAMLDSCLRAGGFKTGRYNSPHLVTVRDSIMVNGEEVDEESYDKARSLVLETIGNHSLQSSEFEITTATAFTIFSATSSVESSIDILLIECGMGGLRDATNVLDGEKYQLCSVLTSVDLDHQGFLGSTVEEIARDKCGIMVDGSVMIVGKQDHAGVLRVVEEEGERVGTDVVYAGWEGSTTPSSASSQTTPSSSSTTASKSTTNKYYTKPPLSHLDQILLRGNLTGALRIREPMPVALPGKHQLDNTALTVSTLLTITAHTRSAEILPKLVSGAITPSIIRKGLEETKWRGRCSWVEIPTGVLPDRTERLEVLVDGAHNTAAATQLRSYIDSCNPSSSVPITYIIGLSHSPPKTPLQVLKPLLRPGDRVCVIEFSTPIEGMPWIKPVPRSEVLDAVVNGCGVKDEDVAGDEVGNLKQALEWATKTRRKEGKGQEEEEEGIGLVIVTGSLYLVADVYRL